jgi:K+-transporting ATPase KdpF subunit
MGLRKGLTAHKSQPITMTNLIVGLITLGLIAYLIFTIIRPEKF